jgi:hypothetical protein
MSLRWRQVDAYHAVSECGRYSVCKVVIDGAQWFEAWFGKQMLDSAQAENSAAMRARCEQHAEQLPPPELSFEGIRPPEDPR